MIFVAVELSHGIVEKIYSTDFEKGKEEIENAETWRWCNPILVAISEEIWLRFESSGEDEIQQLGNIEDIVVAIPKSGWEYEDEYQIAVERNRKGLGL